MPNGKSGPDDDYKLSWGVIAGLVTVFAMAGATIYFLDEVEAQRLAEERKSRTDFAAAHAMTFPDSLQRVLPGTYDDVEVGTPDGPEICKVAVVQPAYGRRFYVPSDCKPK